MNDLKEAREHEEDLGKKVLLKFDLEVRNEYKEKFRISSTKLDEMLASQKNSNDTQGLGYEKGENSKSA